MSMHTRMPGWEHNPISWRRGERETPSYPNPLEQPRCCSCLPWKLAWHSKFVQKRLSPISSLWLRQHCMQLATWSTVIRLPPMRRLQSDRSLCHLPSSSEMERRSLVTCIDHRNTNGNSPFTVCVNFCSLKTILIPHKDLYKSAMVPTVISPRQRVSDNNAS